MALTSLQHLCLNRIAKDIKLWCNDSLDRDMSNYLYLLGPFDNIGSRQIQELLNILSKNKQLKPSYLQTLLHCGLTSLDLSAFSHIVSDSVVKIITRRCQKIRHLIMQNCSRVSSRALQDLANNLPNLHSLDLSGCILCNNPVLAGIGKNCKELHILKLDSCKKVTDTGIKDLCGDPAAVANCSKIVEISLSATSITCESVNNLLATQPYLQSLSLSTCQLSSQENIFNDTYLFGTTQLKYVDLSYTSVDDSVLSNLCQICPNLSSLIVTGCSNLTGLCLDYIKTLHGLKHLHLDASSINCTRDLKPFLLESGYHFETLHLLASHNLDIGLIGQHCCNLTILSLPEATSLTGSFISKNNKTLTLFESCPHLKCLDLQHCTFSETKPLSEHLSSIFCTSLCDLEILNLSGIKDMRHQNISGFIVSIGFSKLRELNISQCPLLDNKLVFLLINSCKNLKTVYLKDCWKVTRCDIETATQMAESLGQQIELIWS